MSQWGDGDSASLCGREARCRTSTVVVLTARRLNTPPPSLRKIFPVRTQRATARVRLFCVPFAGGAAGLFRTWGDLLPEHIDLCAFELPGRGTRFNEPPLETMDALCASLRTTMTLLDDGLPIAFFGHSMGARVAFELARALGARVVHLFVSGSPAPACEIKNRVAHLSEDEFKAELRKLGGTPPEVLKNDELMEILTPVLRADFSLVENYRPAQGASVAVPMTIFAGTKDDEVPIEDAEKWASYSTAPSRFIAFDEGHFFLEPQRGSILREIERTLTPR